MLISLIVPCYNEEEAMPLFYKEASRVAAEMKASHGAEFEFIFVDDFTPDRSIDLLKKEVEQLPPPDGNKCASSTCHRTWERRKPAR